MELASNIERAVKRQRRPRYRRVAAVKFQLQERDLEIIKLVHRYRLISSDNILALLPGSRKGILRRLCFLFHGRYLERPPEQIKPLALGSRPMVYGLGQRGADILHQELGLPKSKIDWARKNREVKQLFLEHTLMISNFLACLTLACRMRGDIRVMDTDEIVQGKPQLHVKTSFKFKGQVYNLNYRLEPDRVFGLHFVNDPPGSNRLFFLVECDRSTMPIRRINPYKSCFEKKLRGYWDCWQKGMFREALGFQNARVITLAKSKERIASMVKVVRELGESGKAPRMFLFALESDFTLKNIDRVLAPIWRNANDDRLMSLVD